MAPPVGTLRVGRYFLALFSILVLLYLIVFWPGARHTPKLGLDLEGGTQVIFTAKTEAGKTPSSSSMSEAKQIMQDRVNGTGVTEATVVIQGSDQIVVSIPGSTDTDVKKLGAAAALNFRGVVAPGPGGLHSALRGRQFHADLLRLAVEHPAVEQLLGRLGSDGRLAVVAHDQRLRGASAGRPRQEHVAACDRHADVEGQRHHVAHGVDEPHRLRVIECHPPAVRRRPVRGGLQGRSGAQGQDAQCGDVPVARPGEQQVQALLGAERDPAAGDRAALCRTLTAPRRRSSQTCPTATTGPATTVRRTGPRWPTCSVMWSSRASSSTRPVPRRRTSATVRSPGQWR